MIWLKSSAIRLTALLAQGFLAAISLAAEPVDRGAAALPEYSVHADSDWDARVAAAQARVAAARAKADAEPLDLVKALTALGDAQLGKGDYASAEVGYIEALRLAGQHVNRNSVTLLDPLRGLGYAQAASGQHNAAIPNLQRALLISRSSFGVFDIGQQGLLRRLARSLTALGRHADAEDHMFYMLRVAEHVYGAGDPRVVPVFCDVGDWYSEVGKFRQARIVFQVALNIVEAASGEDELAAVVPLRALASTYMREASYPASGLRAKDPRYSADVDSTGSEVRPKSPRDLSPNGERALQRALEILDTAPVASRQTLIATLVQMGDWFQIRQLPAKALPYYKRAWQMIAAEPGSADAHAQLNFPVRVYYPAPLLASTNLTLAPEEVDVRYVQVEFTVRQDGTVADAKVVDHDTTGRIAADTLIAIRAARFRPKFVDAEPVSTSAMSYREVFRTRKQEPTHSRQSD